MIQISGADGGTGASPLTSIKHAGGPWELGLAESHQALLLNNLRDRVVLRVDGGLKTGYDVVMGALLGADEFGFGTIAMIAVGCVVARICHTNNCPVGVTTQKEALRRKFVGVPHDMLGFFVYIAEESRQAPEIAARSTRDRPEIDPRSTRDRPEIDARSTRDRREIDPRSPEARPRPPTARGAGASPTSATPRISPHLPISPHITRPRCGGTDPCVPN